MTRHRIIAFALPLFLAPAACGDRPAPDLRAPARARDVRTAVATERELPQLFEAGGVIRARATARLTSRILAPVVQVRVRAGDRVRTGDVLVTLDNREASAHAGRTRAAVAAATRAGEAAAAEREVAAAALELATASHKRVSTLRERGSATEQELDDATAALRSAQARSRGVEARVLEAADGLEQARAGSRAATVGVSYTVVRAPFDGVITERLVDPGNMAAPGQALLAIDGADGFQLAVQIDEARAQSVIPGAGVQVCVPACDPGADSDRPDVRVLEGRVAEVARALDSAGHTFLVKIDLPSGAVVRSGQFARARFGGPLRRTLTVPTAAVVERGQLHFVYVVGSDAIARARLIDAVAAEGDVVHVRAGLQRGEHVVAPVPPGLEDGAPVRRQPAGASR